MKKRPSIAMLTALLAVVFAAGIACGMLLFVRLIRMCLGA